MDQPRYAAGTRRSRGLGVVLTLAVHLALLVLVLEGRSVDMLPRRASLPLTFYLTPPPPPVPPPPRPTPAAVQPRPDHGGARVRRGSPPPAPSPVSTPMLLRTRTDMPSPIAAVDALPVNAPPLPDAAAALGRGGDARGDGAGSGGDGAGAGSGEGAGRGGAIQLVRAEWIYRPTSDQVRPFWPPRALAEHRSGEVLLACDVPVPGAPRRCLAIRETPRHFGFGVAAVRLSQLFRIKPVTRGGAVASGWIVTTVSFDYLTR